MKGRKDPTPLDADPQADAALKRALAALAQDGPPAEELARVRRRLQPLFEQPPPARMPVPHTWRLHLLTFVGAAAIGAALVGQRLGHDTTPLPASTATPSSVSAARSNLPESPRNARPEPTVRIAAETQTDPTSTRQQAHAVSERKPLPTAAHKHRAREASSARTAAPHVAVAAPAGMNMGQAFPESPEPQATHSATVTDSSPQLQPEIADAQPAAASVLNRPDEVSLLQQARRSAGSDPQAALRFLEEHKHRFPHGTLSPEREVLAIELLRALSRNKEAQLRASIFQRDFPGSVYLPRVMR